MFIHRLRYHAGRLPCKSIWLTYQELAEASGVSKECVRYWCRWQRDGGRCERRYRHEGKGVLGRFDGKMRYAILRLRLEHSRWGPGWIRHHLGKRRSLAEQELLVRFDSDDRHFVFATMAQPEVVLCRRPARGLEVSDLTGI